MLEGSHGQAKQKTLRSPLATICRRFATLGVNVGFRTSSPHPGGMLEGSQGQAKRSPWKRKTTCVRPGGAPELGYGSVPEIPLIILSELPHEANQQHSTAVSGIRKEHCYSGAQDIDPQVVLNCQHQERARPEACGV